MEALDEHPACQEGDTERRDKEHSHRETRARLAEEDTEGAVVVVVVVVDKAAEDAEVLRWHSGLEK